MGPPLHPAWGVSLSLEEGSGGQKGGLVDKALPEKAYKDQTGLSIYLLPFVWSQQKDSKISSK